MADWTTCGHSWDSDFGNLPEGISVRLEVSGSSDLFGDLQHVVELAVEAWMKKNASAG